MRCWRRNDSDTSIAQLKQPGDFGIATVNALNGEMVVTDGQVYRVSASGQARVVGDAETTPFAGVTYFAIEQETMLPEQTDFAGLRALIDKQLPSPNLFSAFRIVGRFKSMTPRSVPRQSKP